MGNTAEKHENCIKMCVINHSKIAVIWEYFKIICLINF